MDYLTVKEVAELKGCSERYIRKLISSGELVFEQVINQANAHKSYVLPVSTLPDELQQLYYKQQRLEAGLLPEVKEEKKTAAKTQRSFEELSADERAEVNVWTDILKEWQGLRNGYNGSKVEFDKLYVGKCQLEHPDIKVSKDILYRKWSAYRNNDIEGLIDKRGAWNRGCCKIPAPVWDYFLWCWLDENQPTASLCYRNTIDWAEEFYPELVSQIPTERSFRRQIDRDVAYAIQVLMREGEKAFNDRCAPYIMRMYESLEANDCWIADNHTFDVISLDGGTKHRLYLTAFTDAKSGVMVGWNITDAPCAQSTILALRHGIIEYELPKQKQEILAAASSRMTDMITNATKGYIHIDEELGELLIMDTPSKETATKVWRWNSSGFAYSDHGYNEGYFVGLTMDGKILANSILAGLLQGFEISNGNETFHVYPNGKVKASAIEITGGSINIDTNSESYDVIQLSCGAWTHRISPLEWVLENTDTGCRIRAQAGAMYFYNNDTLMMYLDTKTGELTAEKLTYKNPRDGYYYSVADQIQTIWDIVTGGSS